MAKRSRKNIDRVIAIVAGLVLAFGLLPAAALAEGGPTIGMPLAASAPGATVVASGTCGADGDNLRWTLDGKGTLTISGTGKMKDFFEGGAPWYSSRNRIKAVVIGNGVTSIGLSAFDSCSNLASVTIPSGVESIGAAAFVDCTSLKNATIPSSVKTIGTGAFAGCTQLASVVIPSSVTSIRNRAFFRCSRLKSVTIQSGINTIGNYMFDGCTQLASVFIPSSVTSIEGGAFDGCDSLADVYYGGTEAGWGKIEKAGWTTLDPKVHYNMFCVTAVSDPAEGGSVKFSGGGMAHGGGMLFDSAAPSPSCTLTATPSRGYRFAGWTETRPSPESGPSAEGEGQGAGGATQVSTANPYTFEVTSDRELTANFEPAPVKEYAVTFKNWDGTVLQSDWVAYGAMPKFEGATPKRRDTDLLHFEFAGWEPEVVAATGDATYTAVFAAVPRGRYRAASGEGSAYVEGSGAPMAFTFERTVDPDAAFSHFAGIEVDGRAVPERDASGNANWTARSGSVIVELQPSYLDTLAVGAHTLTALFDDGDPVDADFTVSAPAKHTVTFDANGHGKAPDAQTVEHGEKAKRPANPTADGWTFGGWYTDKDCKSAYDFSAPMTGDVTLYAKWEENAVVTHTVTFDANGHGKAPDAQEVEDGKKAKRPANPTASGYTFGGWYKDKACKEAYDFSAPVTSDVTLYAKWTKKSSSGSGTSPKTGDPLAGAFATALALAAASALALALSRRRSRG